MSSSDCLHFPFTSEEPSRKNDKLEELPARTWEKQTEPGDKRKREKREIRKRTKHFFLLFSSSPFPPGSSRDHSALLSSLHFKCRAVGISFPMDICYSWQQSEVFHVVQRHQPWQPDRPCTYSMLKLKSHRSVGFFDRRCHGNFEHQEQIGPWPNWQITRHGKQMSWKPALGPTAELKAKDAKERVDIPTERWTCAVTSCKGPCSHGLHSWAWRSKGLSPAAACITHNAFAYSKCQPVSFLVWGQRCPCPVLNMLVCSTLVWRGSCEMFCKWRETPCESQCLLHYF